MEMARMISLHLTLTLWLLDLGVMFLAGYEHARHQHKRLLVALHEAYAKTCVEFHRIGWEQALKSMRGPGGRFVKAEYRGFVWREIP